MNTSQEQSEHNRVFLAQLIQLCEHFHRRQGELAELLGVSRTYLNQVVNGREPGATFQILVGKLHKEICLDSDPDFLLLPINELEANVLKSLANAVKMDVRAFIAECAKRYGPQTLADILKESTRELEAKSRITKADDAPNSPEARPIGPSEASLKAAQAALPKRGRKP